ncbi:hypothetical protein ANME2D_00543 [Candidatus Methanoperedens nitroreducens]|uniref:Uncharacterized protein n=1 Tax=Candidatus Methanoperedens nitratireducens TaxID=1392998 RepID=A0A062VE72_9EURY|nr:hypothetical protein [Candidatus Methanoperedens nitroreducens]KCZ73475.1 hypothetical protein ANME2D_00543 [Candidatus Methanoperedens nitroreducens]MDJ1422569.1 hypothetical protein [Candidatus Methanoperedens sp.]
MLDQNHIAQRSLNSITNRITDELREIKSARLRIESLEKHYSEAVASGQLLPEELQELEKKTSVERERLTEKVYRTQSIVIRLQAVQDGVLWRLRESERLLEEAGNIRLYF